MKNGKKLLALWLSFVLCFSLIPTAAFAEGTIAAAEPAGVSTDIAEEESLQDGVIQKAEEPEEDESPVIVKDGGELILPEEKEDAEAFAASVPDINSELSKENALAILKAYDADGYYVVNYMLQKGEDYVEGFLRGSDSNAEGLDTVVHEYTHLYSHSRYTDTTGSIYGESIFIGNKTEINVAYNNDITIPHTSIWSETLPDDLRSSRFDTYVAEASTASANTKGPYGLLNEFMAYCTGMRDQLALFPYYKAQENTFETWRPFVISCINNREAYAEFRFWILGYLDYVKTYNKVVYNTVMSNQEFLDAYLTIKALFENQLEEYDRRRVEISELAAADGIEAYAGVSAFSFGGRSCFVPFYYDKLMEETSKSNYQKIEQAIMAGGTAHIPTEPPVLDDASNSGSGIVLTWSAVDGATKYKISRKASGGSWEALKTVTGTSYTDTSAQMGTKYAYRISAYNGAMWSENSNSVAITFNPFTDVAMSDTIFKYVSWAYNNGVVTGTSATTFSPGNTCTRVQFIMMLWKMHGSPVVGGTNPFSDIEDGTKTCKAILWALDKGIINSGKTFNPKGSITRINIVMILWKLAGSPKASGTNPFSDVSGAKTINAVLWAYNNGITKGTSATTFSPNKNCTRGQLVTFLYKYNNIYGII